VFDEVRADETGPPGDDDPPIRRGQRCLQCSVLREFLMSVQFRAGREVCPATYSFADEFAQSCTSLRLGLEP
jgi:hypothetical protein